MRVQIYLATGAIGWGINHLNWTIQYLHLVLSWKSLTPGVLPIFCEVVMDNLKLPGKGQNGAAAYSQIDLKTRLNKSSKICKNIRQINQIGGIILTEHKYAANFPSDEMVIRRIARAIQKAIEEDVPEFCRKNQMETMNSIRYVRAIR